MVAELSREPPRNVSLGNPLRSPAALTLAVCLLAPIVTLAISLPDGYLQLRSGGDYVLATLLGAPYLLLGVFAWLRRGNRRESIALFILAALLAALGLWALAAEAAGYRAALVESPRGPQYMQDRFQRMALFLVPAAQGLIGLLIGLAVAVQTAWRRIARNRVSASHA